MKIKKWYLDGNFHIHEIDLEGWKKKRSGGERKCEEKEVEKGGDKEKQERNTKHQSWQWPH